MQISYTSPMGNAWNRMKQVLLNPFQAGKWFALGFTAWLATLSTDGGGFNKTYNLRETFESNDYNDVGGWAQGAGSSLRDYIADSTIMLVFGLLVVLGIVLGLVAMWVSSRGQFMFLDNLVHDRKNISEPWHRFSRHGNSLFLWQIGYSLVVLLVIGVLIGAGLMIFLPLKAMDMPTIPSVLAAVLAGTMFFIMIVTLIYVEFFLTSFVVPIMYKEGLSTTQAWSRFLFLFRQYPGSFVWYGIVYAAFKIVAGLAFLIAGLLTCCVGFIMMALPYLGTVVTLPLFVTARYFDLEFLRQFGPEYDLLAPVIIPEENS